MMDNLRQVEANLNLLLGDKELISKIIYDYIERKGKISDSYLQRKFKLDWCVAKDIVYELIKSQVEKVSA